MVLNEQPSTTADYRLAIIGEAPGADEVSLGKPFVGMSGRFLNALLQKVGIARSACFVGNVCQHRPPNNDIKLLDWDGEEIQSSLVELRSDLAEFSPNLCLLLGQSALKAAFVDLSISACRGSLFKCSNAESPFFGYKCLPSFHPAAVLRNYEWKPLLSFDIRRAKNESESPILHLPNREYEINLTTDQIISKLESIQQGDWVSIDIEGGIPNPGAAKPELRFPQGITCIAISTHPSSAFIINILDFSMEEQIRIFRAFAKVMSDPAYGKVLQNSLYDNFVLSWLYQLPIRNVVWDTMLSGWEIYPELPKSLAVQTSLWTKEPYYKFERKLNDKNTHYTYCCKDAAVTLEIARAHERAMSPAQRTHFDFNMSILPAVLYMELRGIRYDKALAEHKLAEVTVEMSELQSRIDALAGHALNVNSPKQMTTTLYRELGFEPQYKKKGNRKTTTTTCDVDALLTLLKKYTGNEELLIYSILKWRNLEGQRKQLEIDPDPDGRVRGSYNIVGTDTGRLSSSASPTGTGTNLQTITKKLRGIYRADPGMVMFQCDLSGADGWTVAAWSNHLGDSTMMDDYNAGIKPARVIAAMRTTGASISNLSQADLKTAIKSISIPEWLYFTCKRVQHGGNYELGDITMSGVIMKASWKLTGNPIYASPADCKALKNLYFVRYKGARFWQQHIRKTLENTGRLSSASGHIRTFFGRLNDHETYRAALSQEPQNNTTYATNLALRNLWYDDDNRDSAGRLIIEPLHQVHDALVGQFPADKSEWAIAKINSYFNNKLTIANQEIVIPYSRGLGDNWLEATPE